MAINENIKEIFKDLKEGEQFSYRLIDGKLFIGVRMGYDNKCNEYEIFECKEFRKVKEGLFKLKKKKVALSPIKEFEEEHTIRNIILLGEDGAIRNIEMEDKEVMEE